MIIGPPPQAGRKMLLLVPKTQRQRAGVRVILLGLTFIHRVH